MKIHAALMLKAPIPGKVKTRLAVDIGEDEAAGVYQQLVEHQLTQIPSEWKITIHFAPENQEPLMLNWLGPLLPEDAEFIPQVPGDLGVRISAAVCHGLQSGAEGVALIGGDCPGLTSGILEAAAMSIGTVIGPAIDGGYVLLLLRQHDPSLFTNIDWSTEHVLAQTTSALDRLGWNYHLLEPLEDVDDLASWMRCQAADSAFKAS